MDIVLTEDQQKAYDNIINFIERGDNDMALLAGQAGSGKSTLCSLIVDYMVNHGLFGKIALTATTNKAVKVAKAMCKDENKDRIDFSSLHSLLGLKHLITKDGKEIYKKDAKSPCKLSFYDLIIVDEASMVSDELFHEIEKQNFRGTKVLFVGDANQINPVNHTHAIPMLEEKRALYNISHFQLTQIVRQAAGNPIIKCSQSILTDKFNFIPGQKELVDKTGVVMLNGDKQILNTLLRHYFCSEAFDKDANHAKVIAWTNATVDMFNSIIRNMKYGKCNKIVLGEKLIADKPIKDVANHNEDEIIFNTNEDLVVLEINEQTKVLPEGTFQYYNCLVRGDEDQEFWIHILHEKSERLYNITLQGLSNNAIKEVDIKKKINKWKVYYRFIEQFSAVNFNYAITAHCGQGSTYENSFIVYNDIMRNNRPDERKRILYTAVTRPKKLLYIL